MGGIRVILDYLKDFNLVSILLRLALAMVVGGIIGYERGRHGSAAGFRTHILVCVGASMTSLTSLYASLLLGLPGDIFRLSAQVISGIGFLGAGIILVRNNNTVSGLTTAAGMWVTATIGMALGYGFYEGVLVGTAICVVTTTFLTKLERKTKQSIHFYAEIESIENVQRVLDEIGIILEKDLVLEVITAKSGILGNVGVNVTTTPRHSFESIRDSVLKIDGISYVVKA